MMWSRNPEKNKDKECFSLYFSTLKNLQMKTPMLFVAAQYFRLDIVYGIYDLRFLWLTDLKLVKVVL